MQGIDGDQETLTIPRSNPTNILFRNKTEGEFRLVAHLGERAVTEGVFSMPATTLEAMYDPAIWARSARGTAEVLKR